jgi:hypothetical protein
VDLVAVERRDERLVQELDGLVRDLVRQLLALLDGAAAPLELRQVGQELLELERRGRRQRGVLVEEVEELRFPREQLIGPPSISKVRERLCPGRRSAITALA